MRVYAVAVASSMAFLTATSALAQSANCRKFEATILLRMIKAGCSSPVGICTEGLVESSDPLLNGATWSFISLGTAELAGLSVSLQPKSMLSYAGAVTVTTPRDGHFTTNNAGVFDTAANAFSQLDQITGGSGKFADAKGRLIFLTGTGSEAGFRSTARGELCLTP